MQQRYYDPVIGRFYSNDPVGFSSSNPMMFNRYAYANNNPYKYVDPDGQAPEPFNPPKTPITTINYGGMPMALEGPYTKVPFKDRVREFIIDNVVDKVSGGFAKMDFARGIAVVNMVNVVAFALRPTMMGDGTREAWEAEQQKINQSSEREAKTSEARLESPLSADKPDTDSVCRGIEIRRVNGRLN